MSRDETDSPFGSMPSARTHKPGELLFEFHVERTHRFYRVELRDHGAYGVEAQFLDPTDPVICRTFRDDFDPPRARALAIAWATEERKIIESGAGQGELPAA